MSILIPFGAIPLNDGNKIPAIAFGTGSVLKRSDVTEYVEQALETGFSHLDTAQVYANEESVGVAIRESGLQRSELFVTTKYDGGTISAAVRDSLSKLGLKQLDLYLIHFPALVQDRLEDAWMEFERLKKEGLTKSIGVSNFKLEHLQALCKTAKVIPAVNQIFLDPYNYAENRSLMEYCADRKIVVEAYSSLSPITKYPGGPVDQPVRAAAEKRGVQPSQILLAWIRAKGAVIVTTSTNKEHLKQYLDVADISLTPEEISAIEEAGSHGRPAASIRQLSRTLKSHILLLAVILLGLGSFSQLHRCRQIQG